MVAISATKPPRGGGVFGGDMRAILESGSGRPARAALVRTGAQPAIPVA